MCKPRNRYPPKPGRQTSSLGGPEDAREGQSSGREQRETKQTKISQSLPCSCKEISGQTYVGASVVVDGSLGHHGVVLELRLAERRSVGRDEDELGLAGAEGLEGAAVAEDDLAGLDDKGELFEKVSSAFWCFVFGGFADFAQWRSAALKKTYLGTNALGVRLGLLGGHCE